MPLVSASGTIHTFPRISFCLHSLGFTSFSLYQRQLMDDWKLRVTLPLTIDDAVWSTPQKKLHFKFIIPSLKSQPLIILLKTLSFCNSLNFRLGPSSGPWFLNGLDSPVMVLQAWAQRRKSNRIQFALVQINLFYQLRTSQDHWRLMQFGSPIHQTEVTFFQPKLQSFLLLILLFFIDGPNHVVVSQRTMLLMVSEPENVPHRPSM